MGEKEKAREEHRALSHNLTLPCGPFLFYSKMANSCRMSVCLSLYECLVSAFRCVHAHGVG